DLPRPEELFRGGRPARVLPLARRPAQRRRFPRGVRDRFLQRGRPGGPRAGRSDPRVVHEPGPGRRQRGHPRPKASAVKKTFLFVALLWAAAVRPGSAAGTSAAPVADPQAERLSERARQDRTIVYFLQEPASHSFFLFHDYTEAKEGERQYVNVVR